MHELIAVIDDEPDITRLVALHLKKDQFKVKEFHNATAFFTFLDKSTPDLLILDLMLPDENGLDICKKLKMKLAYASMPIIMLTAKAEETDRILGLELGADDYVIKPFSPKELVARVKAVLRRKKSSDETSRINIGDFIEMDLTKYIVTVDNKRVDFTTTEFRILQLLGSKKGWVFDRASILNHLWGYEKYVVDRTVDVHIRHIREKLGKHKEIIKVVRGIGYKLEI